MNENTRSLIHISTYDRPTLVDVNDHKGLFEPTTNKHQWNRWRMAVNDRLCEQRRVREQSDRIELSRNGIATNTELSASLSQAPYKEFVVVTKETRLRVPKMMAANRKQPKLTLDPGQFIYFGIPRVQLEKEKRKPVNDYGPIDVYVSDDMETLNVQKIFRFKTVQF